MVHRRSVLLGSTAVLVSLSGCNGSNSDSSPTEDDEQTSDQSENENSDTTDGGDGADNREVCSGELNEEGISLDNYESRREYSFIVPEGETYTISGQSNSVQSFDIEVLHDDSQVDRGINELNYEREYTVEETQEVTVVLRNSSEISEVSSQSEQTVSVSDASEATFNIDSVGRVSLSTDIDAIMTLYGPDGSQVTNSAVSDLFALVYQTGEYRIEFNETVSGSVSVLLEELESRAGLVDLSAEYETYCDLQSSE